ncbi:hypothetical protein KR215_010930 [Drosophila sulfurigaster]|nr:hypothetical protein KR215_010930 [Drosophila sulfurigaster]
MAQDTETGVKDQHTQHDHIEEDEVSELQRPPSFYQKVREQAERFASTRLGQYAIERTDRVLKLLEDTTKWSLPLEKNSNAALLERPLPWVPFLLLIVVLRLTRIWLSVGALMIGNGPVSPSDMIYFIQTRRRKLRAIRVHGLKVMRHRQQEASSLSGKSFTQQLSQWLSRAICRPGVQRANSGRSFVIQKHEPQQNQSVAKRPREEEETAVQNLTIDEMLNKYANENSEDDSDFVPQAEDESATSSSESESHSSDEISSNEEQEIAEKHKSNGLPPSKKEEEKESEEAQAKTTMSNGSNDKEQTEVATERQATLKEDEWKSSPGHMSAALMKTALYNNTAAAASTDQPLPQSQSNSTPNPDTDPDPNDTDTETDSNSGDTVQLLPQTDVETTSEPNEPQTPIHPTIETLTPATSSEDIFYSPIGSPNYFCTIKTAAAFSTPNSELDDDHTVQSDLEEQVRQNISLAYEEQFDNTPPGQTHKQPQQQQQQKQQQQRQYNSHHRYRGRNRR